MEKDWIEYKCRKFGQTLFVYNKLTGEHRWAHGLGKGIEGRIIYGRPVVYKEFRTFATQTDDNGCNNGCMSMYVNIDPSRVTHNSQATIHQKPPGTSDEESQSCGGAYSKNTIKLETHEQDEDQISGMLTANQNNLVKKSNDDDENGNDFSENKLSDTDDKVHRPSQDEIFAEVLQVPVEEMDFSSNKNLVSAELNSNSDEKSHDGCEIIVINSDSEDYNCDDDDRDDIMINNIHCNHDDVGHGNNDDGSSIARNKIVLDNDLECDEDRNDIEDSSHAFGDDNNDSSYDYYDGDDGYIGIDNDDDGDDNVYNHDDDGNDVGINNDDDNNIEICDNYNLEIDDSDDEIYDNHIEIDHNDFGNDGDDTSANDNDSNNICSINDDDGGKLDVDDDNEDNYHDYHNNPRDCQVAEEVDVLKEAGFSHHYAETIDKRIGENDGDGTSLSTKLKRVKHDENNIRMRQQHKCLVHSNMFKTAKVPLKGHLTEQKGELKVERNNCKTKSKIRLSRLGDRLSGKHRRKKPREIHECPFCRRTFKAKIGLLSHLRSQLTNEKPLPQCSFCKKIFKFKCRLDSHLSQHAGERPFKCSVCDKVFRYRKSLFDHMLKLHSGDVFCL